MNLEVFINVNLKTGEKNFNFLLSLVKVNLSRNNNFLLETKILFPKKSGH